MKRTKTCVVLLTAALLMSVTAYPQASRTQPQAMTKWVGKYPDAKFFNQPLIKNPLRRILSKADYASIESYNLMIPNQYFKLGKGKRDFIHIFGNIMEGRSVEQKENLSRKIIERLNEIFPDVSILSINIREFEKATYSNKALLHTLDITSDRQFN